MFHRKTACSTPEFCNLQAAAYYQLRESWRRRLLQIPEYRLPVTKYRRHGNIEGP